MDGDPRGVSEAEEWMGTPGPKRGGTMDGVAPIVVVRAAARSTGPVEMGKLAPWWPTTHSSRR